MRQYPAPSGAVKSCALPRPVGCQRSEKAESGIERDIGRILGVCRIFRTLKRAALSLKGLAKLEVFAERLKKTAQAPDRAAPLVRIASQIFFVAVYDREAMPPVPG